MTCEHGGNRIPTAYVDLFHGWQARLNSRLNDAVVPAHLMTDPGVALVACRDGFGNWCSRIVAPIGDIRIFADGVVHDGGRVDDVAAQAQQIALQDLPEETLVFLLGSRYCETDRLSAEAWRLFAHTPPGSARVQAICDFVRQRIRFGYQFARPTKTAWETYNERAGVCRDYAHLAITFCRCMNIPARYCTGYLGDIGITPGPGPMDFSGWFDVYLGGRWYPFDARSNVPRIGRIVHGPRPRRRRCRDGHDLRPERPQELSRAHRRSVHGLVEGRRSHVWHRIVDLPRPPAGTGRCSTAFATFKRGKRQ
ncbi:MAG: Transglutaminase-like superfamily protein [Candidatus Accumulibacter regalis]|uniref:Transglutaminase-like superfamily protein n=1 Tax=Accumulibacter regalis TaxID=522306 RepID=A0A011RGB5_ACCRE|nr:MAG: Transglutaminase-like superfamily protein [Candidatus Accumulibacter regalis]